MEIPFIIKKYIKKVLERRTVLDSFYDNGDQFNVVDYRYLLGIRPSRRAIENDKRSRVSSAIYLDSKKGIPFLLPVSSMIKAWAGWHEYRRALVLGCAGCAFPRFIFQEYESCAITGVEYSDKMIEIAKKYFLHGIDGRFQLIHGDAFDYVPSYQGVAYDLILVDIFHGGNLAMRTFSEDFLSNLKRICTDNGLVILNLCTLSQEVIEQYKMTLRKFFQEASVLQWYNSRFIALFPGKVGHDMLESFQKQTSAYLKK